MHFVIMLNLFFQDGEKLNKNCFKLQTNDNRLLLCYQIYTFGEQLYIAILPELCGILHIPGNNPHYEELWGTNKLFLNLSIKCDYSECYTFIAITQDHS